MTTWKAFSIALTKLRACCPDTVETDVGRRTVVAAREAFQSICHGKEDDPRFVLEAPDAAFRVLGKYFTVLLRK